MHYTGQTTETQDPSEGMLKHEQSEGGRLTPFQQLPGSKTFRGNAELHDERVCSHAATLLASPLLRDLQAN
jgi:hypothetical protein